MSSRILFSGNAIGILRCDNLKGARDGRQSNYFHNRKLSTCKESTFCRDWRIEIRRKKIEDSRAPENEFSCKSSINSMKMNIFAEKIGMRINRIHGVNGREDRIRNGMVSRNLRRRTTIRKAGT
jgi:hypothetical protein